MPSVSVDIPRDEEEGGVVSQSSRFVSRHRRTLNHIQTDSTALRTHAVPDAVPSERPLQQILQREWKTDVTLEQILPCWSWLKSYTWKSTIVQDLVAGVTVGVMVIPQSMSYAKLANLPVQFGLYSALVPVYAYAVFGTSRQLAVGPVALISLLLSTGLTAVLKDTEFDSPEAYQERYNQLAVQTSFLVGLAYIVMGVCRMGFVTIFLSHAVISGFTTGAAVIIGMSQIKHIFGIDAARSDRLHQVLQNLIDVMDDFNWKTFIMGTISIFLLLACKTVGKTVPRLKIFRALGPLLVTALSISLVVAFGWDESSGIPIVAHIPKGLPNLTVGEWTPIKDMGPLSIVVISIVIVGFMESIAISKTLASKHKYEIDASQELIGLGMSNFLGAMFQAYPITGSFSRSAVNHESGAKSGISAMVTATMVGIVLLLLTDVFEKLPLSVLAAIVISGIVSLIDYPEAMYLWSVHRFDFAVWMVACLGTMFLGVEIGLAIAVGVSLLIVVYESAYPHTSVLGRLPGTTVYRNCKQYSNAERYDGLVLVRIDAPLYFANAQNVRDVVRKYRLEAEKELEERGSSATVKYLILEMSPVSHLDTSALHILEDMNVNYRSRNQQLCFSNPNPVVMKRLLSSGLADKVGREHIFSSINDGVSWCLHEMDCEAMSQHESRNGKDNSTEDGSEVSPANGSSSADLMKTA